MKKALAILILATLGVVYFGLVTVVIGWRAFLVAAAALVALYFIVRAICWAIEELTTSR